MSVATAPAAPLRTTVFERHRPPAALVDRALQPSRQDVLWFEDAVREPAPALTGTLHADLLVVGGGLAGLWTAALAARQDPGRRVVLVEAGRVGRQASGRNGGFCVGSITHGEPNGRDRWPDEYPELERLGLECLDGYEADLRTWGVDCSFTRSGALTVALEPHQVAWAREAGDEFLDAAATRAVLDVPHALGGIRETAGTALVHPGRLCTGLAAAAERLGVQVHENTPVLGLEGGGRGPVTARCREGIVVAEQVALATNVFPSLVRRARLMTVPVYDYVLATEPLTPEQWSRIGWAGGEGYSDMGNQFHYARPTPDGRILFGGYDAVYHPGGRIDEKYEHAPHVHRRLAEHFLTLFPQLEDVRFSHRWAGVIDTSTSFTSFNGLARGGRVAYSAGFTGLGVCSTRFAAQTMLDQLAGADTERTRLSMVRRRPWPFPPEPFATMGIQAARWSLDRADHRQGRRNLYLRALDAMGLGFDS